MTFEPFTNSFQFQYVTIISIQYRKWPLNTQYDSVEPLRRCPVHSQYFNHKNIWTVLSSSILSIKNILTNDLFWKNEIFACCRRNLLASARPANGHLRREASLSLFFFYCFFLRRNHNLLFILSRESGKLCKETENRNIIAATDLEKKWVLCQCYIGCYSQKHRRMCLSLLNPLIYHLLPVIWLSLGLFLRKYRFCVLTHRRRLSIDRANLGDIWAFW